MLPWMRMVPCRRAGLYVYDAHDEIRRADILADSPTHSYTGQPLYRVCRDR